MSDEQPCPPQRHGLMIPVIIIVLGLAWLMTSLQVMPQIDWVFVLLLALSGILLLIMRPLTRARLVSGLVMVSIATGEVLHDLQMITREVQVPVLVILGGAYAAVAHFLPFDRWAAAHAAERQRDQDTDSSPTKDDPTA